MSNSEVEDKKGFMSFDGIILLIILVIGLIYFTNKVNHQNSMIVSLTQEVVDSKEETVKYMKEYKSCLEFVNNYFR